MSSCGYTTNTTKSRLNAILEEVKYGCKVFQKNFDWFVSYNNNTNCSSVYLHGHQIATFDHNLKAVKLSSCGWQTVTTKSRLNAILDEIDYGCKVFQKNFDWFVSYNNQTVDFWDGMILCGGEIL